MKFFVFLQPVNGIADLAQLAERKLPKLQVAGSSPVIRSGAGSLAQLVQSACLTSRRSLVRTQQFPQKRSAVTLTFFIFTGFSGVYCHLTIFLVMTLPEFVTPFTIYIPLFNALMSLLFTSCPLML